MRLAVLAFSFDASAGAGAARATQLQVDALRACGHEVLTVCADDVRGGSQWRRDQPLGPTNGGFWSLITDATGRARLDQILGDFAPDCLILNAVDRGMLSLAAIGLLQWPIVWFVRDSWIYTGGCLFKLPLHESRSRPAIESSFFASLTCDGFQNGCADCPILKPSEASIAATHYAIKDKVLRNRPDIVFAGISDWMTRQLIAAPLTRAHTAVCIPNWVPVPVSDESGILNQPLPRKFSQTNTARKTVLLGAHSLSNPRKGLKLLQDGMAADSTIWRDFDFLSVGAGLAGNRIKGLGHLDSEGVKRVLRSCDVVCIPSLQESQSIFAIEATLHGKPVVCFETSGLATLIQHKVNGYVARAFDSADLIQGIRWVLTSPNYRQLSEAARSISEDRFSVASTYSSSVERAAQTAMGYFAGKRPDFEAMRYFFDPWESSEPLRDLQYLERNRLANYNWNHYTLFVNSATKRVLRLVRKLWS